MLSIQRVVLLFAVAGCCLISLSGANSVAQDIPALTENQKSSILFDIRFDRFIEDAKKYDGSEALENLPMDGPLRGVKFTDLKRIFGSASLPSDLESAIAMTGRPPEKLPFDFFVRIEFNEAEQVEKFQTRVAERSKTIEISGIEFFVEKFGPPLTVSRRIDATTFEVGTPDYCVQAKRSFYTDQLKAAYKTAPDEPVRIVVDLTTRADLINEAVEMGKKQLDNPVVEAYLDLIDNAKSIVFTQSMASENLATLLIEGVNETETEELKGGLDSLLGSAKIAAPALINPMKRNLKVSEKSTEVLKTMIDDLGATAEGTRVSILLKKPEGFEEAVGEIQTAVRVKTKQVSKLNDFRQVGLSIHNYVSSFSEFPFIANDKSHKDLSWRVRVLPFLDQQEIFDQLETDKGPEDEANSKFADQMPKIFGSDGKNAVVSWISSETKAFKDIPDGTSNTIVLIENPNAGPWLKNTPFTAEDAMQLVANLKDGEELVVVLYDGSTGSIDNSIDKETLRNLLDPKDGNVVGDWR